ncbi:MAG: transcription factor S [Fervidicoccaceae archaeon]
MFCPKCGTLMKYTRGSSTKSLVCPSCGYTSTEAPGGAAKLPEVPKRRATSGVVVEEKSSLELLPKLKNEVFCPRCGHDEVYYWVVQTRRADEPPTRFFRCVRCNHTWREYE